MLLAHSAGSFQTKGLFISHRNLRSLWSATNRASPPGTKFTGESCIAARFICTDSFLLMKDPQWHCYKWTVLEKLRDFGKWVNESTLRCKRWSHGDNCSGRWLRVVCDSWGIDRSWAEFEHGGLDEVTAAQKAAENESEWHACLAGLGARAAQHRWRCQH